MYIFYGHFTPWSDRSNQKLDHSAQVTESGLAVDVKEQGVISMWVEAGDLEHSNRCPTVAVNIR